MPAHEEESVVGDCLASLVRQEVDGPVHVVVVANGCDDCTAEVARMYEPAMRRRGFDFDVLELDAASKAAALNAGDRAARYGHRMYLDADVTLSGNALESVLRAFAADPALQFCSPLLQPVATTYTSGVYARVWGELPYVKHEVIGAGCYVVRGDGRRRWTEFPDIVADDKFARLHFAKPERRVLDDSHFSVQLPVGVGELVRVRSRWIRANRELRRTHPRLAAKDQRRSKGLLRFLVVHAELWKDLVPFTAVYLAAELRAVVVGRQRRPRWERAAGARDTRNRGAIEREAQARLALVSSPPSSRAR